VAAVSGLEARESRNAEGGVFNHGWSRMGKGLGDEYVRGATPQLLCRGGRKEGWKEGFDNLLVGTYCLTSLSK